MLETADEAVEVGGLGANFLFDSLLKEGPEFCYIVFEGEDAGMGAGKLIFLEY